MAEDIPKLICENVVQGRTTRDDEGLDDEMAGQPGVTELTKLALEQGIAIQDIINKGLVINETRKVDSRNIRLGH